MQWLIYICMHFILHNTVAKACRKCTAVTSVLLKHHTVQFISFYTQKGTHFGMIQPGGELVANWSEVLIQIQVHKLASLIKAYGIWLV